MAAYYQRLEQHLENDLNHICDSIRYMHACLGGIYQKFDWPVPLPSDRAQPLPSPALHSPPGLLLFHHRHLFHRRTLILVDMILMSSDPF